MTSFNYILIILKQLDSLLMQDWIFCLLLIKNMFIMCYELNRSVLKSLKSKRSGLKSEKNWSGKDFVLCSRLESKISLFFWVGPKFLSLVRAGPKPEKSSPCRPVLQLHMLTEFPPKLIDINLCLCNTKYKISSDYVHTSRATLATKFLSDTHRPIDIFQK